MTGVELTVGGWFASAVIGKVIDLGRSYLGDNYDLHTGTGKMLKNLESQLPRIQSVIEAAEKQQITSKGLDTWLEQLKDAAYKADDVLDDFEAKRIRESIKGKGKATEIASSTGKMVKTVIFSNKELKRLESVVAELDKVCESLGVFINTLQLIHSAKGKGYLDNPSRETSSTLAPDVKIFGRDEEIKLILDMVLNVIYGDFNHKPLDDPNLQQGEEEGISSLSDKIFRNLLSWGIPGARRLMFIQTVIKGDNLKKNITGDAPEQSKNVVSTITLIEEPHCINIRKLAVIPIVGLGGVGKTTVAQVIYNDERVKNYFYLKAWVYVSDNHDNKKIMQDIVCSIKKCGIKPGCTKTCSESLDVAENRLIETINNQRFLIILDDLTDRIENTWVNLRTALNFGEVGSVVVVTTQSRSLANAIGTVPEVKLDLLKTNAFWELFQYYAFGGLKFAKLPQSEQKEFKNIGEQIAKKLHGLPLAGKVIGTLLSTRSEKKFWEEICGSDWWNIESARKEILPSIGVGYNYLESELKQCFVFCSIFPKQCEFERERLVQMWMAHGFIQPSTLEKPMLERGQTRLEDIGSKWFDKLVKRIFFQPSINDGKYVMHDLMWELASAVASNEFCFIKRNDKHLPSSARHLGIDGENSEVEWTWDKSNRLRTVILFGNWTTGNDKFISNIFANYEGLRVMGSSNIMLGTKYPIDAACQLSHLRFVDLSFTGIKSIPDKFCSLCHLQVLDVRGCNFQELPKGMNQLIHLRHLYASSHTISLISSIGKLTKLQELEEFGIEKREGHRISELKDMDEISGYLLLSDLQNISSEEEAAESKLDKKKYLKSLELRYYGNVKIEILDAVKLPPKLEILKVEGSYNRFFPGWMCSSHLKVIHVSYFSSSTLPAFGELPSLELLSFQDLTIEEFGSKCYGSSDVIFPSLKELRFSQMGHWIEWEDGDAGKMIFPQLKKLDLYNCRYLRTLPVASLTSVVELTLTSCNRLKIQTIWIPTLSHFSISNFPSEVSIDCTRLKSIEVLHLKNISGRVNFIGGLKHLVKLRELVIQDSGAIRYTYEERPLDEFSHEEYEKQCLESLTYLDLGKLRPGARARLPRLGRLPSLRSLLIQGYFQLFSHDMEYREFWSRQLTSLEKLEFRNCDMLSCLPSQLYLLTSLKKLHISSCPELLSLPENGLPPNLVELYIEGSRDLIHRCEPNQGDDWHKISHIPFIHFHGVVIRTPQAHSP